MSDSARFIEQDDVDIARGLNRLATLGDNIRLKSTIHSGYSNRG